MKSILHAIIAMVPMCVVSAARATVVEFTSAAQWQAAVGPYATVGFTGFPAGTFITAQYASLGVTFTDGDDYVLCCGTLTFPQDGAGLSGNAAIHLSFASPQSWISVHFPGATQIELYSGGEQIFVSDVFTTGGAFSGFGGLFSTRTFDSAIIRDPVDSEVALDNLYFGVPGSGALPLLAVAGGWPGARRRRAPL